MKLYKQPPKAVLLDWHGTINDMSVVLEQDIIVGRKEFGLELTPEDVMDCWGCQPSEFYPKLFGRGGDTRTWQEMRAIFQSYDSQFPRRLLPGVMATLDVLDQANVVTGLVTSGVHEKVMGYMQEAGLPPERFRFVHTNKHIGEDMAARRPILGKALGELSMLGISAGETVFVGDEPVTMEDAAAAGTGFVVVASGTISKEDLLRANTPPEKLIDRIDQLPGLLGL